MKPRRKLFSKNEKRKNSDKRWDSVLGAGLGTAAGFIGSGKLAKVTKGLRNMNDEELKEVAKNEVGYYKDGDRIKELFDKPPHQLSPDEGIELNNLGKKSEILLNKSEKTLKKLKRKKRAANIGMAALPIAGALLGAAYGHQNNLKKQRNKIEDAAGDKIADMIRGGSKKSSNNKKKK